MASATNVPRVLGRFRAVYWSLALLVLLFPAIAMQVTNEVAWDARDFAAMAGLLAALGFGLELILRNVGNHLVRLAGIAGFIALVLLLWAELATGNVI